MDEEIRVQPLGPHEYAAEVDEGQESTHHRVVVRDDVFYGPEFAETAESRLVEETMRFLLERSPNTALPHDIDTGELAEQDERYLPELRLRVA